MPYFAVKSGKVTGIYNSWDDCKMQIDNVPNSWYKKFRTESEANKCMKSRNCMLLSENQMRYYYQGQRDRKIQKQLSPGDVEFLKVQVEIIREKIAKCISLFSKKMRLLSKRLDMVEYDINSTSQNTNVGSQETWLDSLNDKYPQPPIKSRIQPLDTSVPPLTEDKDGFIDVYIDGAVKGNNTANARGGIGVWFTDGHPLNIADALQGEPSTINAELQAATRAIQQAAAAGLRKLNIHTDSTYMIFSITKWIKFWKANNWRTALGNPVKIRDELERLDEAVRSMDAIKWTYTKSHQGNVGNENADILAHIGVTMNGQKRFYSYDFPEEMKPQRLVTQS